MPAPRAAIWSFVLSARLLFMHSFPGVSCYPVRASAPPTVPRSEQVAIRELLPVSQYAASAIRMLLSVSVLTHPSQVMCVCTFHISLCCAVHGLMLHCCTAWTCFCRHVL